MHNYSTSLVFQQLNKILFSLQWQEVLCFFLLSEPSLENTEKSCMAGFVVRQKCGMIIILGRDEEA